MGLRKRQVEERRDRILRAARKLIADEGVASLTMRSLAESAGLSVPTLYNHFRNKNDILEGLASSGVDRLEEGLAAATDADPLERSGRLVELAVEMQTGDPDYYRAMILARSETARRTGSPVVAGYHPDENGPPIWRLRGSRPGGQGARQPLFPSLCTLTPGGLAT